MKIKEILPLEEKFTEVLNDIALTPKMLYYYGKMPESSCEDGCFATNRLRPGRPPTVAIVGARKYTAYGEEVAYKVAYELAKHGVVVVSGLAYGIDSIAHRGALDADGRTVAVLGTPIDRIYPARHEGLAREIVKKGGVVMSEYAPGAAMYPANFLYRNRLIAALSDVVLVVEANEKSGSLNTAAHALEQGRELWVVPGDVNRLTSVGCNRLLAQGANAYTSPEDLLRWFFPGRKGRQRLLVGDNQAETDVLQALAKGLRKGEELVAEVGLSVVEFNQTIMRLEIKQRVKSLGMNRWMLV